MSEKDYREAVATIQENYALEKFLKTQSKEPSSVCSSWGPGIERRGMGGMGGGRRPGGERDGGARATGE